MAQPGRDAPSCAESSPSGGGVPFDSTPASATNARISERSRRRSDGLRLAGLGYGLARAADHRDGGSVVVFLSPVERRGVRAWGLGIRLSCLASETWRCRMPVRRADS